jgi:hypothetical protein
MKGWLDNFGKADNANDSNVSLPEGFVGLGYNTKGRNYSPAWGGQFQKGGNLVPVSPMEQVQQSVQPTPTVPYLQTKDPAEFYKSWIQSPEYAKRQLLTGYSSGEDLYMPNAAASRESRLGAIEDMTPITYSTREPSKATPGVYGSPSYVNINPSDYTGTSKQAIEAHELAHVAGAMGEVRPGMMSATEQDIFKKSMLPMKEPVLSGVQGSKEREASKRALEDFKHSQEPDEVKADLDALRFMMYDKGIYDITKGKKFTESDFEKSKQNLGNDRVFKRLENRVGKKNFVNLMNTIAKADGEQELPMAMGGMSIPGSVGFTYARTAGSAPSKGKYAKKTMASAQNGQEMKFYQNGLDWKPKSMQGGGEQPLRVSTSDPRYPELYKNRQVGSYYDGAYSLPDLDEVTVTAPRSYTMDSLRDFTTAALYGAPANAMKLSMIPQAAMTEGVEALRGEPYDFSNVNPNFGGFTSNQRDLSQTMGYENPEGFLQNTANFGLSAVDPLNLLGVGVVDDLAKGAIKGAAQNAVSKTLKYGVSPYSYSPEVLARIPENLTRAALGKPKSLPKAVTEVIERNPQVRRTVEDTYNNREDAWSVYLGLPPENKGLKLVGSDEVTGLSKYELTKPRVMSPADVKDYRKVIDRSTINKSSKTYLDLNQPGDTVVDSDKLFGVMGGYSKFISPDGKNIMYRDVWDLQPFSRLTSEELPTKLGESVRNFEVSSLIPGAKPFVSEGKLADIKTKYYPAKPYKDIKSRFNEQLGYVSNYYEPEAFIKDIDNPTAEEIFNYDQMLRDVAKKSLMQRIKNEKTFLNPLRNQDSRKYADFAPYIKVDKSKKKDGGIVKDNEGYWNPENWGKPVEIDSNDITMEGVYEPLLGVSDTGDAKLMKPGKNYKFKGKKVTEFPVAQYGKGIPFKDAANNPKDPADPIRKDLAPPIRPKASFEEQKRIAKLELDKYGYTSDQRKSYVKGKSEKAFRNIVPQGYGDLTQTLDRIERYEKNLGRNPEETIWYGAEDSSTGKPIYYDVPKRDDAFALYLGMPQKNNSFGISEYQPGDSKENKYYFKPNYLDENLKNRLVKSYLDNVDDDTNVFIANERTDAFGQKIDSLRRAGVPNENPIYAEWMVDNPLGDFKMSKGKDKKGHYISIYDEWDLNPFKQGEGASSNPAAASLKAFAKMKGVDVSDDLEISKLFGAGKPFEIYDRIYYDPKTKKVIPEKRNGGGVGINQLDAQPMKKLNQLLNFTNNPDKDNWLDKYN